MYKLSETGLRLTEAGLFYGPVRLVAKGMDGRFAPLSRWRLAKRLAESPAPSASGLNAVANALNKGDKALAQIAALHLKLPPYRAPLAKAGFDPNEPRDDQGCWTDGGGSDSKPTIQISGYRDEKQTKKERFVKAHLADAIKGALRLGVPVENILGVSALESGWGTGHFARDNRNNYFSLHYPTENATGYIRAREGGSKVATFANYSDSMNAFINKWGYAVQGKSDPKEFASALQNTGGFGVNKDGTKVSTYVSETAKTIIGLRSIIGEKSL